MRFDADNELEQIKKRLEALDHSFAVEQSIMNRLVVSLKHYGISPQQAFELFDKNNDGRISAEEFTSALEKMKITNISRADIEVLMNSMEVDENGMIRYKSFVRRLRRSGVRIKTAEEQIIFAISETIRKNNLSIEDAFRMFDKDGNGYIEKKELIDVFRKLRSGYSDQELDQVFKYLYPGNETQIDYRKFSRLFQKSSQKMQVEEERYAKQYEIDWKTKLLMIIDDALIRNGLTIHEAFNVFTN